MIRISRVEAAEFWIKIFVSAVFGMLGGFLFQCLKG